MKTPNKAVGALADANQMQAHQRRLRRIEPLLSICFQILFETLLLFSV